MVSFGEKAKIKKAGNLNYGRSYVITTVTFQIQIIYRNYYYIGQYYDSYIRIFLNFSSHDEFFRDF